MLRFIVLDNEKMCLTELLRPWECYIFNDTINYSGILEFSKTNPKFRVWRFTISKSEFNFNNYFAISKAKYETGK